MKKRPSFTMTEKLFLWSGDMAAWHFLPVTKNVGVEIKESFGKSARGFGSLPVTVEIGKSKWNTSIFPDKTSGSYMLPVKASVRKAEDIHAGEKVTFTITL